MQVVFKKDSRGYLAEVVGRDNLFAHGRTKKEAASELLGVVEMMMDLHLEELDVERRVKLSLQKPVKYAV